MIIYELIPKGRNYDKHNKMACTSQHVKTASKTLHETILEGQMRYKVSETHTTSETLITEPLHILVAIAVLLFGMSNLTI